MSGQGAAPVIGSYPATADTTGATTPTLATIVVSRPGSYSMSVRYFPQITDGPNQGLGGAVVYAVAFSAPATFGGGNYVLEGVDVLASRLSAAIGAPSLTFTAVGQSLTITANGVAAKDIRHGCVYQLFGPAV